MRNPRVPMSIDEIPEAELGSGVLVTPDSVLAALQLPKKGKIYDLDAGRARDMSRHYATPPFEILTYRTPRGIDVQRDLPFLDPSVNDVHLGFVDEFIMGTVHVGAHIDALCHITRGERNEWFGGFSADEYAGDYGVLRCDVTKIPPIVARGVMIDVAAARGVEVLPESYPIEVEDLEAAIRQQGTEIQKGDVILIRTGQMRGWPHTGRSGDDEAGIKLESAVWLTEREPLALCSDSSAFEVSPSVVAGNPQPVHIHVIAEKGIYILEWLYMERLSIERVYEFLFVCLPLKIEGATGSWVRPIAII